MAIVLRHSNTGFLMARSKSSRRWLEEHINDPYVKQAQKDGYRSRASYKLLELNEKDKLIRSGMLVMDLGSAPGGWSHWDCWQARRSHSCSPISSKRFCSTSIPATR